MKRLIPTKFGASLRSIQLLVLAIILTIPLAAAEEVLNKRIEAERSSQENPFIISQHRANYILPFTYSTDPNQENYTLFGDELVDNEEAKYQLSIKVPLYNPSNASSEGLYLAFTLKSWWQVYNSDISAPFRETNYEPELFYHWTPNYDLGGLKVAGLEVGINHQSNGRTNPLSRSWNRVVGRMIAETDNFFYIAKLWYRLPEDEKENSSDPVGDDNPDIIDYMGNFEFIVGTRVKDLELSLTMRNNLSTSANKGYYELNAAYPLTDRFDILVQYANGYGESLIDYNYKIERFGIGFQLASF
ncbi:phospholipase A [uncultured Umboniibacter sp.]|uniref:phospholipase A n=1 Tax=uncultured Umboniibacter sp. TaxID=1798917 RepID=UPI002633F8DB|nr:phospholipase A [uncultured Umboniibacter sp.]